MNGAQGSGAAWYRRRLHGPLLWFAWLITGLLLAYIGLVIYRVPAVEEQHKSEAAVAEIQARHLTMNDVDGNHLPPPPDPAQADATVAGVDANGNGIRDDVELAIFAKYPGEANIKIRAAELQYAMAEQMFLTDVFDSATWKAVAVQDDRAFQCLGSAYPKGDAQLAFNVLRQQAKEVESLVFNTSQRIEQRQKINLNFETSLSLPNGNFCDVNVGPPT